MYDGLLLLFWAFFSVCVVFVCLRANGDFFCFAGLFFNSFTRRPPKSTWYNILRMLRSYNGWFGSRVGCTLLCLGNSGTRCFKYYREMFLTLMRYVLWRHSICMARLLPGGFSICPPLGSTLLSPANAIAIKATVKLITINNPYETPKR